MQSLHFRCCCICVTFYAKIGVQMQQHHALRQKSHLNTPYGDISLAADECLFEHITISTLCVRIDLQMLQKKKNKLRCKITHSIECVPMTASVKEANSHFSQH